MELTPFIRAVALLPCGLVIAGCSSLPGLYTAAKDAVVEEFNACKVADAGRFVITGAALETDTASGEVSVANASGRIAPEGTLTRIFLGLTALDATVGADGFTTAQGVSGAPVAGVTSTVAGLSAYGLTFPSGDARSAASLVLGVPSAGTALPTTGQALFSGPIALDFALSGADTVTATGLITVTASYASQQISAQVTDLKMSSGTAPFAELEWIGLAPCNTRVGSAGRGTVQAKAESGRVITLVGASTASPTGTAILDGAFYGLQNETAAPRAVGGVLLMSGDQGTVSGIFLADLKK
ncbi:MAG: hypothetical protein AAFU59_13660 [Pseudomonadota bacterium]